ncbi:kinase-like domain-containing protein [Amylostereum chailletii]|nr:kinase-like domain-containing protein [Amylostereum chailletii]
MLLSPRQPSSFLSPNPSPSPPPRHQPDLSLLPERGTPPDTDSSTHSPTSSSFFTSSSGSFPAPPSPHSKTAAFFSTPVSSPNPPSHAKLPELNRSRSRTDDFFSTWLPSRPTPPASTRSKSPSNSLSSRSDSTSSSLETPDDLHLTVIPPPEDARTPNLKTASFFSSPPPGSRSRTADFFSSSSFNARPTPPPSLRSVSSNTSLSSQSSHIDDATPKPKPLIPSMARLFPSRHSSLRDDDSALMTPHVPHRGFVDIEEHGLLVSSPTSIGSLELSPHDHPHYAQLPTCVPHTAGSTVHVPHSQTSYELVKAIGQGAFSHVWKARANRGLSEVVAVKILSHAEGQGQRRRKEARAERAAFRREVDVLEYLSAVTHRSLPAFHGAFSLPDADVVVLEYVAGGELLELVNSDEAHAELSEALLKRMWAELVDVVAWMHSQGVVHRDIKLENILLTTPVPSSPPPPPDVPLIKLTDFGLARGIDPADPWLRTRCGSESYAAPELLLTSHASEEYDEDEGACTSTHLSRAPTDGSRHVPPSARRASKQATTPPTVTMTVPRKEGAYDGRETDAWALGVALFALATRGLPFEPPPELEDRVEARMLPRRERERRERERKAWVLRVVRGEVVWPEDEGEGEEGAPSSPADDGHGSDDGEQERGEDEDEEEVKGAGLAGLAAVKRIVGRLLVRDPRRRTKVAEMAGVW